MFERVSPGPQHLFGIVATLGGVRLKAFSEEKVRSSRRAESSNSRIERDLGIGFKKDVGIVPSGNVPVASS